MNKRNKEIIARLKAGATNRAVAKIYGLSHQRISQIWRLRMTHKTGKRLASRPSRGTYLQGYEVLGKIK